MSARFRPSISETHHSSYVCMASSAGVSQVQVASVMPTQKRLSGQRYPGKENIQRVKAPNRGGQSLIGAGTILYWGRHSPLSLRVYVEFSLILSTLRLDYARSIIDS